MIPIQAVVSLAAIYAQEAMKFTSTQTIVLCPDADVKPLGWWAKKRKKPKKCKVRPPPRFKANPPKNPFHKAEFERPWLSDPL